MRRIGAGLAVERRPAGLAQVGSVVAKSSVAACAVGGWWQLAALIDATESKKEGG